MRQHRLALCEVHFVEWVEAMTLGFIKKYRMFGADDKILVAVSGGKDSLSLWRILLKLGYRADGLYLDLGIDDGCGYSSRSGEYVQRFAETVLPGSKLHVLNLAQVYGKTAPEMAGRRTGGRKKLCSVCGLVKRHEINRIARELGYTVVATGHNLDDEAATLFGNVLRWESEYLARQSPVLSGDRTGMIKKTKPLARFYERETAAYAIVSNIDYIQDECPFSVGARSLRLKEVLNSMENGSPGTKLHFYFSFLRAKGGVSGIWPQDRGAGQASVEHDSAGGPCAKDSAAELAPCRICGQATTAAGLCAFCRLVKS
jgi:tRNA(Ile)-lysidine synthase TilS/MesJ